MEVNRFYQTTGVGEAVCTVRSSGFWFEDAGFLLNRF
jgi:hypothetical protein